MRNAEAYHQTQKSSARVLLVALLVFHQPATTAIIVVDGTCNLADAIESANTDAAVGDCAAGSGTDEIQLTTDVTLTAELPSVTTNIALEGNDHAITRDLGAEEFRILFVDGAAFSLSNATLSNGSAVIGDGARGGGAIRAENYAALGIDHVTFLDNQADYSAGAISLYDSRATINHSTFSGNSGTDGGAIHLIEAEATLLNSTLTGNSASEGGGVYASWYSSLEVENTTFTGNHAGFAGGAVAGGLGSIVSVKNSTLSGNTAGTSGGGVYAESYAGVGLVNSTVTGNGHQNLYGGFTSGSVSINNTIVANALSGSNCAGSGSTSGSGRNFDDDGTCENTDPIVIGVDFDPLLADNGGPTQTHALLPGSVAADSEVCSLVADQRGFGRTDGLCDSGSFELGALPQGVGGSVAGIDTRRVTCQNRTTLQAVTFDTALATRWDCEQQGLVVSPGDAIVQTVVGTAVDGAAGRSFGATPTRITCTNVTSGQSASVPVTGAGWRCTGPGGLVVQPGDRIQQVFRALAD